MTVRTLSTLAHRARLRALTDHQLDALRARAVIQRAQRVLEWAVGEKRKRAWLESLPDPEDLLDLHRRTDAELLEQAKRALGRFRRAYGADDDASFAARMEAARLVTCLRRAWADRHGGGDLIAVLARAIRTTIRLPFLEAPPGVKSIPPDAPTRRTFAAG